MEHKEEENEDKTTQTIDVNDWCFQTFDLIKNCQHYYTLNKLSKIKDIILYPLMNSYVYNKSLLQFEEIFRNELLSELNNYNNGEFEFIMASGYCCGSKNCRKYLTNFANNVNDEKYAKKYMNWRQTFQFWSNCMSNYNNGNNSKIQIILTPQIGKLMKNSNNNNQITQKVNDFHCRLILTIIISTSTSHNFECIYSIYDCNGTEIDLYQLISDEYEISSHDFIQYPFLYHIKHSTISLNGIGYYMNQWIKFYNNNDNKSKSCTKIIGSCYFFVLWSSISICIAFMFNKTELIKKCQQISQVSKGISFTFQSNEMNYMKMNIIRLLNYDIQRLVLSKLIIDARSYLKYKVTTSQFHFINDKNTINKEARTKQTANHRTPRAPRKQTSLYRPRKCIKQHTNTNTNTMTSTIDHHQTKSSSKIYYYNKILKKMTSSKQFRIIRYKSLFD